MANPDVSMFEEQVRRAAAFVVPLRAEVGRVLVGQDALVDSLLIGLLTNGHVLVEGVPGLAKTLTIKTLAQAVGGTFARLQFTPDLLPADLIGTTCFGGLRAMSATDSPAERAPVAASPLFEHVLTLRIRYSETDQMGTFYNSRPLEWFECGRTELLRALGLPYAELEGRGVLLPFLVCGACGLFAGLIPALRIRRIEVLASLRLDP